jgi:hypothetical protein
MGKPSKAVQEFMAKYKIATDEVWEVHGTAWVVKHKALERVAVEVGIQWEKPELKVCDIAQGFVVCLISGKIGEHTEFSFGEASPKNNKNSYPVAMAEKRAKDRVILKLLTVHGDLYSDVDDIPEPAKRQNPHVTRPEDIYDGEISHDIPVADGSVQKMKVKDARLEYPVLLKEMQRCQDPDDLREWAVHRKADIQSLPGQWPELFRIEYTKHKNSLSPNVLMAG